MQPIIIDPVTVKILLSLGSMAVTILGFMAVTMWNMNAKLASILARVDHHEVRINLLETIKEDK